MFVIYQVTSFSWLAVRLAENKDVSHVVNTLFVFHVFVLGLVLCILVFGFSLEFKYVNIILINLY